MKETIIQKYQEFQQFLESIDVEELKGQSNRNELKEFVDTLQSIKHRNIESELLSLIKKMKEEEFPQLLGVHHYPDILHFDFLNDKEKLELDKFLMMHRVGDFIVALSRKIYQIEKREKAEQALLDCGIAELSHFVKCSRCSTSISGALTKERFEEIKHIVETKNEELFESTENDVNWYCSNCDDYIYLEDIRTIESKTNLRLVRPRDASLDNV